MYSFQQNYNNNKWTIFFIQRHFVKGYNCLTDIVLHLPLFTNTCIVFKMYHVTFIRSVYVNLFCKYVYLFD